MKLTVKILIIISAILLVGMVIITGFVVQSLQETMIEAQAVDILAEVKEAVLVFDQTDIDTQFTSEESLGKINQLNIIDPAVFQIKIWDSGNKIVYSSDNSLVGEVRNDDADILKKVFNKKSGEWEYVKNPENEKYINSKLGPYMSIFVPILNANAEVVNVVEIYITMSKVATFIQSFSLSVAGLVLIVGVSILIALYLSLYLIVVKPIKTLNHVTQEVAQGVFNSQIVLKSSDELGQLFTHFDEMRQKLSQVLQHLQILNSNLEQKVTDRTKALDQKLLELEKMNSLMVGRELKMVELKKEIAYLKGDEDV